MPIGDLAVMPKSFQHEFEAISSETLLSLEAFLEATHSPQLFAQFKKQPLILSYKSGTVYTLLVISFDPGPHLKE